MIIESWGLQLLFMEIHTGGKKKSRLRGWEIKSDIR